MIMQHNPLIKNCNDTTVIFLEYSKIETNTLFTSSLPSASFYFEEGFLSLPYYCILVLVISP